MAENLESQNQSIEAPPEPEISIRTMASDILAIEQGGGQMILNSGLRASEASIRREDDLFDGNLFKSSLGKETSAAPESVEIALNKSKLIVIIAGIFLLGLISGLIGYFVIFPWLFK